jgi:hypothetical protein
MAVYRLLRDQAFEPETISTMTGIYADVCRALGVSDGRATDIVAKTVIKFAQRGAQDRILLRDCVLAELRR